MHMFKQTAHVFSLTCKTLVLHFDQFSPPFIRTASQSRFWVGIKDLFCSIKCITDYFRAYLYCCLSFYFCACLILGFEMSLYHSFNQDGINWMLKCHFLSLNLEKFKFPFLQLGCFAIVVTVSSCNCFPRQALKPLFCAAAVDCLLAV